MMVATVGSINKLVLMVAYGGGVVLGGGILVRPPFVSNVGRGSER
jgi:hypothetical protein